MDVFQYGKDGHKMNAQEMWRAYGGGGACETVSFGSPDEEDRLAALILAGKKRATSSAYYWYESGDEPMPKPGQLHVVVDSGGEAVCIIRTTKVYVTEFCRVTARHAALEGEGDLSLAYWRREHLAFFKEDLAAAGQDFTEKSKVVCEEFEKVYPE